MTILLDTNVLVSAIVYGGKPQRILESITNSEMRGITSPALLAELGSVLTQKFNAQTTELKRIERKLRKALVVVYPHKQVSVLKDKSDNKVLEAALEGGCRWIITGDHGLLELKTFKGIEIITVAAFWRTLTKYIE